ncbi:MAG: ferric reductase-like transmembrane domain-containing protein [Microgenomates group bacterium]
MLSNLALINFLFYLAYVFLITIVGLVIKFDFFTLRIGNLFGQVAVAFYILTLLSGIFRRLNYNFTPINLLRLYRRHLGISMFLCALSHLILVKLGSFQTISAIFYQNPADLFGSLAVLLSLLLFITSNDYSQRLLKTFWFVLHRLTYIIMFFIFLHLALLGSLKWSGLFLVVIALEIISYLVNFHSSPKS